MNNYVVDLSHFPSLFPVIKWCEDHCANTWALSWAEYGFKRAPALVFAEEGDAVLWQLSSDSIK